MRTGMKIARLVVVAFVAGGCAMGAVTPTPVPTPTPIPTPTPEPAPVGHGEFHVIKGVSRAGHTATLLPNGKVLIAGGRAGTNKVEASTTLFDPSGKSFTPAGSMTAARSQHTATLLRNGLVLIAGGNTAGLGAFEGTYWASSELFDPATNTFKATGSMSSGRSDHSATLLADGRVLIAGGTTNDTTALASAELYDPATGTFTATGSMLSARMSHTATLLPDGKVLIAGGADGATRFASAEIYDPVTGSFRSTGEMSNARVWHSSTLLPNGKVLIAGGTTFNSEGTYLATAELYDPNTGKFSPTGSLLGVRALHTATLLANGKVLIAGGTTIKVDYPMATETAELYDPSAGTFTSTGSMTYARWCHVATLLASGDVLIEGGGQEGGGPSGDNQVPSAEIYTP